MGGIYDEKHAWQTFSMAWITWLISSIALSVLSSIVILGVCWISLYYASKKTCLKMSAVIK
jgi:hypothetical protein